MFLAIDDLAAGAGDGVRLSIEFLLGDDLDLVGQPVAQRAQCDRLIGMQLKNLGSERMQVGDRGAVGPTAGHLAFRAVFHEPTIFGQLDPLREHSTALAEHSDLAGSLLALVHDNTLAFTAYCRTSAASSLR